jgi:Bpu10I restriction endonuclease
MKVHGDNLLQKERSLNKYSDKDSKKYLVEIRRAYEQWVAANEALKGPLSSPSDSDMGIIEQRVLSLTTYKDFIDQQHYAEKFDSRSNLHSSVLEEFMFYLFRDMITELSAASVIGRSRTFKDLFFMPASFQGMTRFASVAIERKDHDFIIGTRINANFKVEGSISDEPHVFDLPAVAIECKTYLDKTMLEGSSTTAEQLKSRNPNALYIVVAEWLKLTQSINLKKYKVDQIFVLRKQRNTDREYRYLPTYEKNPIYLDVVLRLFEQVRAHLTMNWEAGVRHGLERGYLL